ncbi:MAG: ATP-binding protein [Spirochaetaceae bacterium]
MKKTVWIVDDEMLIGLHLTKVFEENGYDAAAIKSGEACLERIEAGEAPDLILMDINLGGGKIDGPETTRRINEMHDIPVVLHSAYTDRETLSRTENMAKYGYVQKVPGNEQFVLATVQMALKLHEVEQALREREQMYRDLSNHLQRIREEQMAHMAREIHDDLGQSLAALKMNLTMITKTGRDPAIAPLIADMREILDQTVKKVRALAQELRPPVLDTTGIIEALRWHAKEFAKSFGVETLFECELNELELGKNASLAAFRILQEALTNSVRHGNPTRIRIKVTLPREKELEVAVSDDGTGFVHEPAGARAGFGLLSMRERAQQVGGSVEVESAPGRGTTVRARIPVGERDD